MEREPLKTVTEFENLTWNQKRQLKESSPVFYLANSRIRAYGKGELEFMNKFDNFRAILSQFTSEISPLAAEKAKRVEKIKKTYLPDVQKVEIEKLNTEFEKREKEIRAEHLHTLEATVHVMKSAEQGKTTSRIDFNLLSELNALSTTGIPLTKYEISQYAERSLLSGSSICCRKIVDMARKSGFKLSMPDGSTASAILDSVAEQMNTCIRRFDGNSTIDNNTTTDEIVIKMVADGNFLNALERQFESVTVSDLVIDEIDENGNVIQREEERKIPLNYSISFDGNEESPAAKYAKEYSERMAATHIEVGGI